MASRVKSQVPQWGAHMKRGAIRSGALIGAMGLVAATMLVALALISYHPSDAALNTAAGNVTHNLVSVPGAWAADILLTGFGPAFGLFLALMLVIARRMWHDLPVGNWSGRAAQAVIGIMLLDVALGLAKSGSFAGLPAGLGGAVGVVGETSLTALSTAVPGSLFDHSSGYWALKLIGVTSAMAIAQEETFGPVAPIMRFDTLEEAIAIGNETEFGLTAAVFTNSLNDAWKHDRPAGTMWVLSTPFQGKTCFRVLWGRYPTRDAARRALASIPSFFSTPRNHPVVTAIH